MKKFLKICLGIILVCFAINTRIYASDSKIKVEKVPFSKEYKEWLNLPENIRDNTIEPQKYNISENTYTNDSNSQINKKNMLKGAYLPSKYNTLDYIDVKVKNQKTRNICWAFSLTSAVEIACHKYENENYEFSPLHLDYGTIFNFKDKQNPFANVRSYNGGGNYSHIISYLTNGQGPILEEYMKFDENLGEINYSDMPNRLASKNITVQRLPGIAATYKLDILQNNAQYSSFYLNKRENIKKEIIQSGSVMASINADMGEYYNSDTKSLYYDDASNIFAANHQVILIGYDDNYSVDNFNSNHKPIHNGAYIALNSWGKEFGNDGVFYISYDDLFVENDVLYVKNTADVDYDNVYRLNSGEKNDFFKFYTLDYDNRTNQLYTANVFKRDITKREELTKIYIPNSIYFEEQDVDFEVYINTKDSSIQFEDLTKVDCDVTNLNLGEEYINLTTPIELTGESFAVVIKYKINGRKDSVKLSIDGNFLEYGENYSEYFSSLPGQSYISSDGSKWDDLYDYFGDDYENESQSHLRHYRLTLKAYTKEKEEKINIEDISSSISNNIFSNIENDVSAYITTTANLNGSELKVQLLKDEFDLTDKIQIISIPNVKSKSSDIKMRFPDTMEEGVYKLRISTSNNLITEKTFEIKSIERDDNFIQIQYEDENFINILFNSLPEINQNSVVIKNKDIFIKKEFLDNVYDITLSSNDKKIKITSLSGIENFTNLEYLKINNIDVKNIKDILKLNHLKYLYISNSFIDQNNIDLENTFLKYISLYNCGLEDISKIKIPNTLRSIDLGNNKIAAIPQELVDRLEYIDLTEQEVSKEYVFEKNNSFELIDIPDLFKYESIDNLIFKNCEYDETLGKIKINTENTGSYEASVEIPWDNFVQKKVNVFGSKYKINYIVKEKSANNKIVDNVDAININNPKTGTSVIYIYIVLISCIFIYCTVLNLKKNKKYLKNKNSKTQ